VRNYLRILITGDSDWLVPAGFEERRFAVFDVGEDHLHAYFAAIDAEMNAGGRLLKRPVMYRGSATQV
jgi:hypothetical protein